MQHQPSILNQMQVIIDHWQDTGDGRAIFLRCYQLMTANVLTAVESDEFHSPIWVKELLHRFAGYYFVALDDYDQQSSGTPAVWKLAFDAARSSEYQALQKLILGVNAHINYDLVLTLVDMLQPEWAHLAGAELEQRYEDHCHINDIIGETIDRVQDQIIEPTAPSMALVDTLFGPLDEWLTSRLISRWREEVWQNALAYLAANDENERDWELNQIESATLKRAGAIALNDGVLDLRHLI